MKNMKMINNISIEITRECPFNCTFCSTNKKGKNKHIPFNTLKTIIGDIVRLKISKIQLSGGEPFQHPKIYQILKYIITETKLNIDIYTSGVTEENNFIYPILSKFYKYLRNKRVSVRFNLQTIKETKNDTIESMINKNINIKLASLHECIEKGVNTEIQLIPMRINLDELENIIKHYLSIKVNRIKLLRLIPHQQAQFHRETLEPNTQHLKTILQNIEKGYPSSKVVIGNSFSNYLLQPKQCGALKNKLMIDTDLKLFPCTAYKNQKEMGIKITKTNTLRKIVTSGELNSLILNFKLNVQDKCDKCKNIQNCKEICPIQKYYCMEN